MVQAGGLNPTTAVPHHTRCGDPSSAKQAEAKHPAWLVGGGVEEISLSDLPNLFLSYCPSTGGGGEGGSPVHITGIYPALGTSQQVARLTPPRSHWSSGLGLG